MRDACAVGGSVMLAVGAGAVYWPAGLMVFGGLLLLGALWGHHRGTTR